MPEFDLDHLEPSSPPGRGAMTAKEDIPDQETAMLTSVHGDISCINRADLDAWLAGHHWPVSEAAFHDLATATYASYAELVQVLPTPWNALALADVHFVQSIVQILHGRMVAERCEADGLKLILSQQSRSIFQPNFDALGAGPSAQIGQRPRLPIGLLRLRRQLLYNRHLSPIDRLRSLGRNKIWSLGTESELKTIYAGQRGLHCNFPKPVELLAAHAPSQPSQQSSVDEALSGVIQTAIDCADLRKPADDLRKKLLSAWQRRLCSLHQLHQSILSHQAIPETILLGGASFPPFRIVSLAAREKGTKIVAFQHGHNLGFTDADIICFNDYAICDEFVCATKQQIPLARRRAHLSALSRVRDIHFVALETDAYQGHRQRYQLERKTHNGPKRVMIIGSPMSSNRSTTGVCDAYYHWLRLDILMARALKGAGYRVLYKPHPSSLDAATTLIGPEVDEMPTAPFEDCCTDADTFIFGTPLTTTFGMALCTDTPIVMIDPEGRNWNPEIEALLRKRCEFVAASLDGHNRINLDLPKFVAAIETAPERRSNEFFERFLTPEPTDFHAAS